MTDGASFGPSTDRNNTPVVDPSLNVLSLVEAAVRRLDDLRTASASSVREVIELRSVIAELRAEHQRELRVIESGRLDAIRAVDVAAVQQAAQVSATQATTLAAQVATSAETLRTQVAAAATASTVALAAALEPIQKDIADLRRAQYEAQGKTSQVIDSRSGSSVLWGAVGVIVAALSLIGFILAAVLK